jgi:hypothetical protein
VSALLASCCWWRYPVKPPKARLLDHTRLKGKNRAKYPVRIFTRAECRRYIVQEWRGDQYDSGHLSPRQKQSIAAVWQPWSWRTSRFVTKHITLPDRIIPGRHLSFPLERPVLVGHTKRVILNSGKFYTYDRPLIATSKPKHKLPAMPKTLWGEACRLVIPTGRQLRKIPPSFKVYTPPHTLDQAKVSAGQEPPKYKPRFSGIFWYRSGWNRFLSHRVEVYH